MAEHRFIVPAEAARERLDRFLAERLPELSRSRAGALIREGAATVADGAATDDAAARAETRPARRLTPGAEVFLRTPPPEDPTPAPQPIALDVAFEDEALIVVDKPAGLVVHPAPGNPDGTLVNALLAHCGDSLSGIGGVRRPGIVHRLDKDTSGLIVAAKTDAAHRALARQFARHDIDRAYRAVVRGVPHPPAGTIDGAIGRHPRHRRRMAVAPGGKPARTHYTVESRTAETAGGAALVCCTLETGRTHQIRVHLAHRGWPVAGDPLYGGRGAHGGPAAAIARQALHAAALGFTHPSSGLKLLFESALPNDIKELARRLGLAGAAP